MDSVRNWSPLGFKSLCRPENGENVRNVIKIVAAVATVAGVGDHDASFGFAYLRDHRDGTINTSASSVGSDSDIYGMSADDESHARSDEGDRVNTVRLMMPAGMEPNQELRLVRST